MEKDKIYTSPPKDLCLDLLELLITPVTPDNFEESMKQMETLTAKLNAFKNKQKILINNDEDFLFLS